MKNRLKRLLLIMLMALIALTALACNDKGETNSPGTPPPDEQPSTDEPISKSIVFEDIRNSLVNAGTEISAAQEGVRNVTSEYTFRANGVNIEIEYFANYVPERREDSEIMLRIFDYTHQNNVVFVYYDGKDLYYDIGGDRARFASFGAGSMFDFFYDMVTSFDMSGVLYSQDFAENIETLSTFAESANITRLSLDENKETINIRDINLDRLRGEVNDFITENIFELVGDRLDALSGRFLGFDISDVGRLQIGLFTATEFRTVLERSGENYVNRDFRMVFEGTQNNNIDTYYLSVDYAQQNARAELDIPSELDPALRPAGYYESEQQGDSYMTGTLELPFVDGEFDVELKAHIDTLDNSANRIGFEVFLEHYHKDDDGEIQASRTPMISVYFVNGNLYIDAEAFINAYLGGESVEGSFIDFEAIGLPKLKLEGIDLSAEINYVLQTLVAIVSDSLDGIFDFDGTETGDESAIDWSTVFSKIESEGDVFRISVDSELVEALTGQSITSLIADMAADTGIDSGIIDKLAELGLFEELVAVLEYDTASDTVCVSLSAGNTLLMKLTLRSVDAPDELLNPDGSLIIEVPDAAELQSFKAPSMPDVFRADFTAEISTQQVGGSDISKFLGLFIGDPSGNNSEYVLGTSEVLSVRGSIWDEEGEVYIDLTVNVGGVDYGRIRMYAGDFDYAYVDNYVLGVRYRLSRASVIDNCASVSGGEIDYDSVIEVLYEILGNSRVSIESGYMSVAFIGSAEASSVIGEFLGIERLSGNATLSFGFAAPVYTDLSASDYPIPEVNVMHPETGDLVTEAGWTSIYEAVWYTTASVAVGNTRFTMTLTYSEESTELKTGVYEYRPRAALMGANAGYTLYFTDTVNGTNVVERLYGNDAYNMVIDPSAETPFPETIAVVYDSGAVGRLKYTLEYTDGRAFEYNNSNIRNVMGGLAADNYVLVLGKGSIAETKFEIRLSILGRIIYVAPSTDGTSNYYNNIPIVARVSIDPYEYSQNPSVNPIRYRADDPNTALDESTALVLTFYGVNGGANQTLTVENFDWNFDTSLINYSGGEYYVVAKYQTLEIALAVTVEAKKLAYIQINDENRNEYTVDVLIQRTYTIPSATDEYNEVRIYFETGHYRILGNEASYTGQIPDDVWFDGFYEGILDWSYSVATFTPVSGTPQPLNDGRDYLTTAIFGDRYAGTQSVSLAVRCPSRSIGTRSGGYRQAVVEIRYDSSGNVAEAVTSGVSVSLASFTADGDVNSDVFYFDPYSNLLSNTRLPSTVFVEVEYRGRTQKIEYPITWIAEGNVIDAGGNILNKFADETLLRVRGVIGDNPDPASQTVLTMLVLNRSGAYESLSFAGGLSDRIQARYFTSDNIEVDAGSDEIAYVRYYLTGLNPYDKLVGIDDEGNTVMRLPSEVTLHFAESSGLNDATYGTDWYFLRTTSVSANYTGSTDDDFICSALGGTFVFASDTAGDGEILSQTIELYVVFDAVTPVGNLIFGITGSYEYSESSENVPYQSIDTYTENSLYVLDGLTAGLKTVEIGFRNADGSMSRSFVSAYWADGMLEAFMAALQSPYGSIKAGNPGSYTDYLGDDNLFKLSATIERGTPLETTFTMCFDIGEKYLNAIAFNNFDSSVAEMKLVNDSGSINIDNNTYIVTVERINALRTTKLATPSEYVEYLLSNIQLTVNGDPIIIPEGFEFALPDDFDRIAYGTIDSPGRTDTTVTVDIFVEKLRPGSCVQSVTVRFVFTRETVTTESLSVTEYVETFAENGTLLYETDRGYVIPDEYTVNFTSSGAVTYTGLVWYASNFVEDGDAVIEKDERVEAIDRAFLKFTNMNYFSLYTILPNGTRIERRILFRAKDIGGTQYAATDENGFTVTNGTIVIPNVYEILDRLDNFEDYLPTEIRPYNTTYYTSAYQITFTLYDGWKPAAEFDDGTGGFSAEKLKQNITSKGFESDMPIATAEIAGYNGELQTVQLYLVVSALTDAKITFANYEVVDNVFAFDPYGFTSNNGIFVLPTSVKINFAGGVSQSFGAGQFAYSLSDGTTVDRLLYNNASFVVNGKAYVNEQGAALPVQLNVRLPDSVSIALKADFIPRNVLNLVSYTNTANDGTQSAVIEGTYYIDPYDGKTYGLPNKALFTFATGDLEREVTWSVPESAAERFEAGNGMTVYKGGDYSGAEFEFVATLPGYHSGTGYAGKDLNFVMRVIVLNRTAVAEESVFTPENPFTVLAGDLNNALTGFAALSDSLYKKYNAAKLTPVTPDILWMKDGAALSDDDLNPFGGYEFELTGFAGFGVGDERTSGQLLNGFISAEAITFAAIGTYKNGVFESLGEGIFEFNPYTMECAESEFVVQFDRSSGAPLYVTFRPEGTVTDEDSLRAVIGWDSDWNPAAGDAGGSKTFSVKLYNDYKRNAYYASDVRSDGYLTPEVYRYITRQIGIDWLDLGYGFAQSGEVELVIDPFNPVIPTTGQAKGNVSGSADTSLANAEDIGTVSIFWNSDSGYSVYDLPISGEYERTVFATVVSDSSDVAPEPASFVVRVSYLNRTPETILTSESNYSTSSVQVSGFYTLMNLNNSSQGSRNYFFAMDPTNTAVFSDDPARANAYYTPAGGTMTASKYILPSTLRITYANNYAAGSTLAKAAERLGTFLELVDIEWIISRDITLVGTATSGGAITAEPRRFKVRYQNDEGAWITSAEYDYFSDDGVLSNLYELLLSTTERQIHHTDISTLFVDKNVYYQRSDSYYIDPYNIEFPSEVTIYFGASEDTGRTFTDITWQYDETFLERPDVVTGIDQNGNPVEQMLRYVAASIPVFGTTLTIRFPVRQRNIDTTTITPEGETTTTPLNGGTLYVLKGIPLIDQLPDRLYYEFEVDGVREISSVPLTFDENSIGNYNTDIVGNTYQISGNLGIDPGNIRFYVVVVDPMLYTIESGETSGIEYYYNGTFLHNAIVVGVNRAGQYVPGPEETMLPDRVIVDDSGTYWDIERIEYFLDDKTDPYAVVYASYEFITLNDSDRVYGDDAGGRRLTLSFKVPVVVYDYTSIEDTEPSLAGGVDSITFDLGTLITPYDMPLASNMNIMPLWSFDGVNANRAGEYTARYSYKNAYGSTLSGEITVVISKRAITADDVTWINVDGVNFLDRTYTGQELDVTKFISFNNSFLRADGSLGALEGFTVEYSIDDGLSWQSDQPLQVRLDGNPMYRVRIIIHDGDDYNYTGSLEYRLEINRSTIDVDKVYFYTNASDPDGSVIYNNVAQYVYDGSECIPYIGGLPEGAEVVREYAVYDPDRGDNQNYQPTVRPVTAGTYAMRVTFAADQRNFILSANVSFVLKIEIAKATISADSVSVASHLEYNGEYRDAVVTGLPEGVNVRFVYRTASGAELPEGSRIIDAGDYEVDVIVDGGTNYNSLTLMNRSVTIDPRKVIVDIGTVSTEYLDDIAPYASAIRVLYDLGNGEYEAGLVGRELAQLIGVSASDPTGYVGVNFLTIFAGSAVLPDAGELTPLNMVGSYPMGFTSDVAALSSNYSFTVVRGSYDIVAEVDGAVVIDNAEQLTARLETLRDGDTARWYLREGDYGSITISVNASVSVIGSYRTTQSGEAEIAVSFDSITVNAGAVYLDILSFEAVPGKSSVSVAKGASLSVSRSEFVGSGTEHMAVAIRAGTGYAGELSVTDTYVKGYANALYMETGSANVSDSVFEYNNIAVNVLTGTVTLNGNTFRGMTEKAVYIGLSDAVNPVIADNEFLANVIAVESFVPLRNDIDAQNKFSQNASDIVSHVSV